MLKLWIATVEVEVLIASEEEPSDFDIKDAASEELRDNMHAGEVVGGAVIVDRLHDVPQDWRDSIPRGDADDKTCEQIVNEYLDAEAEAASKRPMPNQTCLPLGE